MNLKVEGAGELVNRLSRFDQEVYKILLREVKDAASDVAEAAKDSVEQPLRKWGTWNVTTGRNSRVGSITTTTGSRDLSFTESKVKSSIRPGAKKSRRRGYGTTGVVGVVNMRDPGGSVFSTAGKAKRGASTNSTFVRNIVRKWGGKYPRILGPAWEAKGPGAGDKIDDALDRAKRTIGL